MSYEIVLTDQANAEGGKLSLHIEQEIEIRIDATEARRLAGNWIHMEVSAQMGVRQPQIVLSPQSTAYWRIPVYLTLPSFGDVGDVGAVPVDITTGTIVHPAESMKEIQQRAQTLSRRFTPLPA